MTPLLVGTHFYQGGPEEMRRQARVLDGLGSLAGISVVDLQWHDMPARRRWIETLPVLRQASTTVTAHAGRVKPLVSEMFNALAAAAARIGSRCFVFFNADCLLTPDAIELVRAGARQVYAFSRMNHDASGKDLGMYAKGLDAFAIDVSWWRSHRRRFRPYIVGERSWDNVYGAIAMCHADAVVINRDGMLRHEAHPIAWGTGPFDAYNRFLTALDFRYFRMWDSYYHRLLDARAAGASAEDETAIARDVFAWRLSPVEAAIQAARSAKARMRYRRMRGAFPPANTEPPPPSTTSVFLG